MLAAVNTRYGPPDVVRVAEVDRPAVGDRDVLIHVRAATVNRTDCGFRAAEPFFMRLLTGLARPRVTIQGGEFAGVIAATGAGVTAYRVGDRVFGFSRGFGAHAEYVCQPEDGWLTAMPANVTFAQAAASTEGGQYALSFIHTANVHAGQSVLVYGATGAIGSALVQLLKHTGAQVTAVCAGPHLDLVRGLGADRVVDYTATDFTRDSERYDAVFDAVGKTTFRRCRRLLKPRGLFLAPDIGPLMLNPVLALVTLVARGRKVMFPLPKISGPEMVRQIGELLATGEFHPVIDRSYPLADIVDAYRYVETGQKIGNVIISMEPA
jgi:NADPH:quinone reductase-like Zn-dependent oxidoreductase